MNDEQRIRRRFGASALVLAALLATHLPITAAAPAAETEGAMLEGPRLAGALREGGKVIFIRHASTEQDYADQIKAVMGNCATQRALSEVGWHEAQNIGAAIDWLDIPVGKVVATSPASTAPPGRRPPLPSGGTRRTRA